MIRAFGSSVTFITRHRESCGTHLLVEVKNSNVLITKIKMAVKVRE
jgi:hypothetical protein